MQHFIIMFVRVRMIVIMAAAITAVIVIMIVIMVMAAAAAVIVMTARMVDLIEYAVYLYSGVIVHMQALAAVIADFKRIEIAKFALAAIYAIAIV